MAIHDEMGGGDSQGGPGDSVGKPVGVVLQALVGGDGAQAIAEQPAQPAHVVVARFGEHRAD